MPASHLSTLLGIPATPLLRFAFLVALLLMPDLAPALAADPATAGGPAASSTQGTHAVLPDGSPFPFWDDTTVYTRSYHVDPAGDDAADGSAARPFRTISRAAALLQPGEEAIIRSGVYRERVTPARGGTSASAMIRYRAAPGATVVVSASEVVRPEYRTVSKPRPRRLGALPDATAATTPSASAADPASGAATPLPLPRERWTLALPDAWFQAYDPFASSNLDPGGWFPWWSAGEAERFRVLAPRGVIYLDGAALPYAARQWQDHWAGKSYYTVNNRHYDIALVTNGRLGEAMVEAGVREQCFAPRLKGLGYIRVSGLTFCHAANGIPQPHQGALGTGRGHHWIIEDCHFRDINTVGLDLGGDRSAAERGGFIVRRNRFVACGTAGIFGTHGIERTLIEDNVFERIGTLQLERCYEAAGIKFHFAYDVLIRRNLMRRISHACGIWLDLDCANNRVSRNAFLDIETLLGAVYVEANAHANLVDGNVIADLRDPPGNTPPKDGFSGGNGVSSDISEDTRIEHNLILRCGHYAIAHHLAQKNRTRWEGVAACDGARIRGNVLPDGKRIYLARRNDNQSDANLLGLDGSYCLEEPGRDAQFGLEAWQRLGFDRASVRADLKIEVRVDTATMILRLNPQRPPRPPPHHPDDGQDPELPRAETVLSAVSPDAGLLGYSGPGPIPAAVWQRLCAGETMTLSLPPTW